MRRQRRPFESRQIQINPFVEGYGVAVATSLPVAGHTRFHQQPLALVVVIGRYLVRQRGTRAHDAHPFCQDEKTRLPAEMPRLDGRDARYQRFKPNGIYIPAQTPSTTNRRRKNCARTGKEPSHWAFSQWDGSLQTACGCTNPSQIKPSEAAQPGGPSASS